MAHDRDRDEVKSDSKDSRQTEREASQKIKIFARNGIT